MFCPTTSGHNGETFFSPLWALAVLGLQPEKEVMQMIVKTWRRLTRISRPHLHSKHGNVCRTETVQTGRTFSACNKVNMVTSRWEAWVVYIVNRKMFAQRNGPKKPCIKYKSEVWLIEGSSLLALTVTSTNRFCT